MFFVSLLVLVSTARATMIKTQKGSVCRPKGNPSGGYCTIPSFEQQLTAAECLQKCDDWADCMCGVASDLKNGKFYCHLFVGENVAPTKSVCQSVLGAKAVGGAYHPFGKLKCGSKYAPGSADGDSVSIYESDFEYADQTCPRAVNGKIRSAKGKTCRPKGNGNGGYCTIPSFSKQYAPDVCLSKCEQWDKCECGVASDLKNGAFYCHLFTGENVAPTKQECEKVFDDVAAVQGLYQPWGALKCNTKYPLADAEGETVSVHNPNFVYKENCPVATAKPIVTLAPTVASNMVRSPVGKTCRPQGGNNGGYCTIPSFAKQLTPEECLTKCENWDECKCGLASDLGNGSFYCHLFVGENVAPTKEECVKVFGNDAAVQGLYQPFGALKCGSKYSLGDGNGKTVSVHDPTFEYKKNCPVSKMKRSAAGQTCRKKGTANGGYCTMPSNVKHPSPEECLSKCENWNECKCGIASDLKNGNFYCHLFVGENVAPTKATCEKIFGSDKAVQGLYQPFGALTCGKGYTPGAVEANEGQKTVSVYDPTFVYEHQCPKATPEPTPAPTKAILAEDTTPKPSSTCWKNVAVGYIGGNQQSGWYWADHGETSLNECFKLCEATNGCKAVDWQADAGGRCNLRGCSLLDTECAADRVVNKAWNIYECRPEPVVTPKPTSCWNKVADGYIGGNQQTGWYWGDHGKKSLEECFELCDATNGCKSVDWQADAGGRCNLRGCSLLDSKCAAARVDNKLWNIYECRVKDITEVVTPKPSQPKINCFASEFVRQKVQTATSGEKSREHEAVAGSGMVTNFAKDTMSGGSSGCKSYCAGTKYAVWWQNTAVTPGEYHSFFCRCHNVCVDKTANAVYKATVYELQKESDDSGKECGRIGRIKKGPKFAKLATLNAKSACECSTACKNKSATEWTFKARNGVCRCLKNAKVVDFTTSRKRTTVGYFASSVANVMQ